MPQIDTYKFILTSGNGEYLIGVPTFSGKGRFPAILKAEHQPNLCITAAGIFNRPFKDSHRKLLSL